MTEKELSVMKKSELEKLATLNGIVGARKFKKSELVNMLLSGSNLMALEDSDVKVDMKGKTERLEKVEPGVIVAFRTKDGKVKSAKIVKKSSEERMLKLETSYGKEYIISYDDVIWLRTGSRWPRGVYNLLKGNENGQEANGKDENQI